VDRQLSATLVIAFLVVVLGLAALGWRSRRRRQRAFPAPQQPPATLGALLGTFPGFYVATTVADDRFNRVAVGGLGFRAKSAVEVYPSGLVVPIAGQRDTFIPAGDISAVSRATWTIDRVVEQDGLIMVAWRLGATAVESYFRVEDPEGFRHILVGIVPAPTDNLPAPTESDSK